MLTTTTIDAFTALSGGEATRYAWQGVGGCSRFDANRKLGSRRQGARLFLFRAQRGLCPDCGLALDESAEFCHIVSRGLDARTSDEGKGWLPGNLFLGHRVCPATDGTPRGNKAQQARGPVVRPEHLLRPDVIPAPDEWPPTPILRALAKAS
jgi:hypothetical protein